MDFEDLLPLIFIALTFIGSLFRKKKKAAKVPKDEEPNLFETILEELSQNKREDEDFDIPEFHEPVKQEPVYVNEPSSVNQASPEQDNTFKGFNDAHEHLTSKHYSPLEVEDLDNNSDDSRDELFLDLSDYDEQRKAIIYAEVLKAKYL